MRRQGLAHSYLRGRGVRRLPARKSYRFFFLVFGLTLVAFAAVDVRYIGQVFNHSARWGFLAALFTLTISQGTFGRGLRGGAGALILIYIGWVLATVMWSEIPALSLAKGGVNALVVLTCLSAGFTWVERAAPEHSLTVFALNSALAVIAGTAGAAMGEAQVHTSETTVLYSGLAYNPNLLGILIIMSMPWTLWFYDQSRNKTLRRRLLAYGCLALLLLTLILTRARSSILSVCIVGITYVYYRGFIRIAITSALAVLAVAAIFQALPGLTEWIWGLMEKGQESGDLLYSRREVWGASLAGAKQGGLFGSGFGVSAGAQAAGDFLENLTAVGYGREKGNSALAVIEELGQTGFVLYVTLLLRLLWQLIRAARVAPTATMRVQLALVLGTLLAMIVNSQFEAWWTAPGSPGFPFFWSLAGAGLALSLASQRAERYRRFIRTATRRGW